ncbi:hypothetical protein FRB99_006600 [Tulasnella sp. 403]|nr:hypothetical protein FRB99_006600 [Tulasnella sp. 403]
MIERAAPWVRAESAEKPTSLKDWVQSDVYHNERLIKADPLLEGIHQRATENGLPQIAVSEAQAKFLSLLVKSLRAKKVLEVGTLAGYSTVWMAKGLPADGAIITLELEEKHAEVARANFAANGVADKIRIIVGPAAETLKTITEAGTFDLAFIDADKHNNTTYFKHAERLVRSGGVIIVDNVVRNARVADPDDTDDSIEGVRVLLEYLKTNRDVDATTIATAGEKGYDGFLYAVKL